MAQSDAAGATSKPGSVEARADTFRRVIGPRLDDAYRLAGAILGSPSDAADAVHDAFLIAWKKWPSLRDPERLDPWFRQIIVNVCRDRLRRSTRRRTVEAAAPRDDVAPDPARGVQDRLLIEHGLRQLKPDDTVVLALRYYRDLKVDDIADVLGIPSGTVKSRLSHAQRRLRDVLGAEDEGGAR